MRLLQNNSIWQHKQHQRYEKTNTPFLFTRLFSLLLFLPLRIFHHCPSGGSGGSDAADAAAVVVVYLPYTQLNNTHQQQAAKAAVNIEAFGVSVVVHLVISLTVA